MSWEQSDGEDSVEETGTDRFVDATSKTEVELCLPLEVDMEPDRIYASISRSTLELSAWTSSVLIRESGADSNPRTGPNRSGPDRGPHSGTP